MCGSALTSWRMKSSCEPCISAAIMIEKPTPIATPTTATTVCRARVRTWVHAMSTVRSWRRCSLVDDADAAAIDQRRGGWRGHAFVFGEAGRDLDDTRAANADFDVALPDAITVHDEHARP